MAEVLTPILQTSTSMTMLHTSPDVFQNASPPQNHHHQHTRSAQLPRSSIYNPQGGMVGYRGTAAAPVAPYAFQSTPNLRLEHRSSPTVEPYGRHAGQLTAPLPVIGAVQASSSSASTVSTSSSSNPSFTHHLGSKDDTALPTTRRPADVNLRPLSSVVLPAPADMTVKPSPDRYRRSRRVDSNGSTKPQQVGGSAAPSGSGMATVGHLYNPTIAVPPPIRPGHQRTSSADDTQLPRQNSYDQAKRYRRRSLGGFEPTAPPASAPVTPSAAQESAVQFNGIQKADERKIRPVASFDRPNSHHERQSSGESVHSHRSQSRPSSVSVPEIYFLFSHYHMLTFRYRCAGTPTPNPVSPNTSRPCRGLRSS